MSYAKHGFRFPFKLAKTFRVTPEVSSGLISEYLESLDCARSLTVDILFRNGEHVQLGNLEFIPLEYEILVVLRGAYAAS